MPGLDAEQIDMWDYWDEAQPTPEPDKTTTMDKVREGGKILKNPDFPAVVLEDLV